MIKKEKFDLGKLEDKKRLAKFLENKEWKVLDIFHYGKTLIIRFQN